MNIPLYVAPTVSAMTDFLRTLPSGKKTLIFCEDRFTLEAERAVASARGAAFDVSVTTFARFLSDGTPRKVLSKQGSVLVVGGIAVRLAPSLCCFGKNPSGCASALYETIAQLRAALVTPEMLDEARKEAGGLLVQKLQDISLVYREYLAFLEGGYLDESGVLALLPAAIARENLKDAEVLFVGFSSFTRQAAEGIRAAIRSGAHGSALLIGGEEAAYTNEGVAAFETYAALAGAHCEKKYLPSALVPEAEALRKTLFDPSYPAPVATDKVFVFEGADTEDELRFAAARIRGETARGVRFRDITQYLPDPAACAVTLEKVFGEYEIPYYADVQKSLSRHPLARFVLTFLSMISEGFEPSDADAFVGSEFFGGERKNRDTYRNYLLRYANFRGGCKRPIKEEAQQKELLEGERARLLSAFENVRREGTGVQFTAWVRRLLEVFGCDETQEKIATALSEEGLLAESSYFSRGYEGICRVLDEAEELAGCMSLRAEEFASVLSEALSALEISLIPQYLDAVFVGSITESRRPTAKVVFAAGLTDGVPPCGADTALISDRDIDRLRSLQVEITPKIREINARARENILLALCGFSEKLYLSYPLSEAGEERKRSEIVGHCCALYCREKDKPVRPFNRAALERAGEQDRSLSVRELSEKASERIPAVRELLERADLFRRGKADFTLHNALYSVLRERGEAPDALLFPDPVPRFVPEAAQVLLRGKNYISPTLVEKYFECPYRCFAENGLYLARREEASVRAADTGDYMHELLRRTAEKLADLPDTAACDAFVRGQAEQMLAIPPYCYLKDTDTGGYSAESLLREAVIVCRNMYLSVTCSEYSVAGTEQSFGFDGSALKGVELRDGIALAGKIDRVDASGEYRRVIDYKTGRIEAKPVPYYTGRKLQLELYLTAASQGAKPAGAYYFPAQVSYHHADELPFRMLGYTLDTEENILRSDTSLEAGKKSRFIEASYRGKGKRSSKLLVQGDFEAFLGYSLLVARQGLSEVERGCIAASPYKEACEYCPYGSLCNFERGRDREETKITETEIAAIVKRREEV